MTPYLFDAFQKRCRVSFDYGPLIQISRRKAKSIIIRQSPHVLLTSEFGINKEIIKRRQRLKFAAVAIFDRLFIVTASSFLKNPIKMIATSDSALLSTH